MGQTAVDGIVAERNQRGAFRDLFDFCARIDLRKVNRRMLEALICAGGLDRLGANRATLMASLTQAIQAAEQQSRNDSVGQEDLFGNGLCAAGAVSSTTATPNYIEMPEWSTEQRLLKEKETLGLYLTGHPIKRYEAELTQFTTSRIVDLKPEREQKAAIIAGLVVGVRTMNGRNGERMAFITLDDSSGRVELAVYPENYRRYSDRLVKDRLLVVEGSVRIDEYSGNVRISGDRI
ncbi:MAG: DNA polymerase III subunit alpha, partial [Halothiobacillaceae bacterium]